MREAVRSGRRSNFFITENKFIDFYARKVGGNGVAVYSILQRCANSETRETWISAGKMAEVLDMDRSTVYRHLKQLEDLHLIKTLRTRDKTIYIVLPVPAPREETASTPLFDAIDSKAHSQHSTWPTVASLRMILNSDTDSYEYDAPVAPTQQSVATTQPIRRATENCNKEEQDLSNKTQVQDLRGNKTQETPPIETSSAVVRQSALRLIQLLGMPETQHNLRNVEDALLAEVRYTGESPEDAAHVIARAAVNQREKGTQINKFWFEDARWRTSNGGRNKAEQQFDRINQARERAIENIRARSRSQNLDH
jgi:hypothetical protein